MPLRNKKLRSSSSRKSDAGKWGHLESQISEEGCVWHSGESIGLTGLSDLKVIKCAELDTWLYFFAKLENSASCNCGADQSLLKKHGWTNVLRIKDLPVHMKKVIIFYKAQRHRCLACKQTWQAVSEQINDSHRMTTRLFKYVREESMNYEKTFVSVEREVGINNLVVRNIQAQYAVRSQQEYTPEFSPWIAIDEVYPTSRKEPRCVISAPLENRVIDILVNNDAFETLGPFLLQINGREKIEVVSMDMFDPYRAVVRQVLKTAKIVVDRFHVQKMVNNALKDIIAVIRRTLTREERDKYLCRESFFLVAGFGTKTGRRLKRDSKFPVEERERLMRILFDRVPEIDKAYRLKEEFADILNLWDFEKATQRARIWLNQVEEFMNEFYEKYKRGCLKVGKKPFSNVVSEFNKWFDEILNYVLFKRRFEKIVSNAYAENLNRRIKELNRKGYGYNFSVLRSKFVFGESKSKFWSDPLKASRKRKSRIDNAGTGVNQNSNVSRIVEAVEQADKAANLISDPMDNEKYRERSPLVKDEAPRETDNRGLPVPRSWRSRRKVKVREYSSESFDGGNIDESETLFNSIPNLTIRFDPLPMCQKKLEESSRVPVNEFTSNQIDGISNDEIENSHIALAPAPNRSAKVRKTKTENSLNQVSLFDLIPGTQRTLFQIS